jgi:hypothetical protein
MSTDAPRPDQPWDAPVEPPPPGPSEPPAQPEALAPPVSATPEPAHVAPEPPVPPAPVAPAPVAPAPVAPAPGGIYPPGVYAAGTTVTGEPVAPITVGPEPKKRGGLIAAVIAGVLVILGLFLKFGLPILVGTAVSGVLGGVFGGPFEKLPADQKQALEQRFDAATKDILKGMSDAETMVKVDAMLTAGMPRLSDELLVEKVQLTVKLLKAADEPTCARVARATATGKGDDDAMSAAIGAMDTASIGRWFEINVSAVEAESKGSPAARTVAAEDSDRVLADVFTKFSDTESQQIGNLYNGAEVSDADACTAFRALYTHITELPPADLAIAALYDVSP